MPDCYDKAMNLSIPMLICDDNEDFRSLLRDMLIKHGFFHVVEAASMEEAERLIRSLSQNHLVIIQSRLVNDQIASQLRSLQRFMVLGNPEDERTALLAVQFGVKHLLSFPFASRMLFEKISDILNTADY
jgi:DNA-binding NtrC family response regulator